jgi:two-component system, LytTR family, response regulator AlgR
MNLRILIADDEPLARSRLRALVEELGHVVCAEAADADSAERELHRVRPDVLLLDIEMPGTDGLALAKQLEVEYPDVPVVLVTAHNEYAVPAFDAAVKDYVLKPVRKERLDQALRRIGAGQARAGADVPMIRLKLGRKDQLIPLKELDYFCAEDGYVVAHSARLTAFVETRLNDLEDQYAANLIRVHRSYLAVKSAVAGLETVSGAEHRLMFHDGTAPIPVSRRQLRRVRQLLAPVQANSRGRT